MKIDMEITRVTRYEYKITVDGAEADTNDGYESEDDCREAMRESAVNLLEEAAARVEAEDE